MRTRHAPLKVTSGCQAAATPARVDRRRAQWSARCGNRHERFGAGRHAASGSAARALTHGPDPRASSRLRRPVAAVQRRLPGRREHPGVAGAHSGGSARTGLARARQGQPAAGDPRTGLLPPMRERLQPRQPGQRRFDPLRRAVPRRPGAGAGLAVRPADDRAAANECSSSGPGRAACRPPTTCAGSATRWRSGTRRSRRAG